MAPGNDLQHCSVSYLGFRMGLGTRGYFRLRIKHMCFSLDRYNLVPYLIQSQITMATGMIHEAGAVDAPLTDLVAEL